VRLYRERVTLGVEAQDDAGGFVHAGDEPEFYVAMASPAGRFQVAPAVAGGPFFDGLAFFFKEGFKLPGGKGVLDVRAHPAGGRDALCL